MQLAYRDGFIAGSGWHALEQSGALNISFAATSGDHGISDAKHLPKF